MFGYRGIVEDLVVERLLTANEERIPIIISGKDCNCDDLEKFVSQMGGKIKYKLPIINSVAAYMPSMGIRSMAMERVTEKIFLDDYAYKLMNIATVTVGSDFANEHGLTGKNISIAVLDTGVFPHEDLTNPNNRIVAFKDFVGEKSQPYDDDGHGTHVAGIVAGNGFASRGKYMGIAPDANIVGVKVLGSDGGGSISDVIAGIQWTIDNRSKYNIKVMTLSLGTKPKGNYADDPLCQAVDAAVNSGITVVAAAGNSGPDSSTITSPAISPKVITVGACDDRKAKTSKDISIADFSSRGPTPNGLKKPDILAPGVGINSLANKPMEYRSLSGTSMATPIVAGCAALLYESNSEITPSQVKSTITSNAHNLGLKPDEQGTGLLDIRAIVNKMEPNIKPKQPQNKPNSSYSGSIRSSSSFNNIFLIILIVIILLVL
ncbi:S8 family peptidase [Alkaliphilus sp. B6464]|uniref:S8 family peptidase n=1 Tax=Alkaliphilus sp. B6464 TaxID=2731219 RepID=UPI001BAC28CD|nr:S8 family peptidase [Alkaliphilus sp. B6464]QUH19280.1 S8 family peptidase [Alkaliphilus sp. B6464]